MSRVVKITIFCYGSSFLLDESILLHHVDYIQKNWLYTFYPCNMTWKIIQIQKNNIWWYIFLLFMECKTLQSTTLVYVIQIAWYFSSTNCWCCLFCLIFLLAWFLTCFYSFCNRKCSWIKTEYSYIWVQT